MNNLLKIRKKNQLSKRVTQAQLLATKNGEIIPYRKSFFEKRINEAQKNRITKFLRKFLIFF
tara:strand:+ start:372 stop:557 length:186 start_codon:yes stop_codon:yes gene_type:complete